MFIVIWTVLVWVPMSCPDAGKVNEYTGQPSMTGCLVMHRRSEQKQMSKEFNTRKEAEDFMAGAPKDIRPSMRLYGPENLEETSHVDK